jgi:hypothetical protein
MVFFHSIDDFCSWLKVTPFSVTLQTIAWIVPAVQTVHILAISAVISSVLMITLRAFGLSARDQPLGVVVRRFLPVIAWSLPILLVTGLLMITAEPARSLENPAFFLKMSLLLVAIAVGMVGRFTVQKAEGFWESSGPRRWTAKLLTVVLLSLWVAIIFAGRWIAYVQPS